MISMLSTRWYRVGLIAALCAIALIAVGWHNEWVDEVKQRIRVHATPISNIEVSTDAHKLSYADAFHSHFYNIAMAPAITMQQAKEGCIFDKPDEVNLAFGPDSGWGLDLTWVSKDRGEKELSKRRTGWHDFILNKDGNLLQYDAFADRFEGKGIVIVGGQGRSLKRVRVILRQLNKLKCKLPIELHYWGAEMSSEARKEISQMYHTIYFQNIASPDVPMTSYYNKMIGIHYSLKTVALINARFEEIIMLDSDNVPVINPEELFESWTYKEYGSVFWPDIQRTRGNNPMWPITNQPCQSTHEWELESGQLMVNKKKFWYHLQLAAYWITDTEHGNYYKSMMLGDKDCFRWAWHALKTKFGTPSRWVTTVGTVAKDQNSGEDYYCGHTFAHSHPDRDGPIAFLHGGLLKTMRNPVIQYHIDTNEGGIWQAYKRDPHDQDKTSNPKVGIKWDGQGYLPPERKPEGGLDPGWCTDFYKVDPRPFTEIVSPDVLDHNIFKDLGGYWMLNEDDNDGTALDGNL